MRPFSTLFAHIYSIFKVQTLDKAKNFCPISLDVGCQIQAILPNPAGEKGTVN